MVGKGVRDILASLVLEASSLDIEKEDSQDLICRRAESMEALQKSPCSDEKDSLAHSVRHVMLCL